LNSIERFFQTLANAFPVWVVLGAALALWQPATALWFKAHWIPLFLGIIMLGMGLTLETGDFRRVLRFPRLVILGTILHYGVMPSLGFLIAKTFHLQPDFMIGLILVASVPGGTASTVICYLARINVALSVTLTSISTLLGVAITPVLTTVLVESLSRDALGKPIDVNTLGLLIDTFQVVILPVTAGLLLKHFFPALVRQVTPFMPFAAVLSIVFIVDYILAAKHSDILSSGPQLVAAIVTLHSFGFLLGYLLSKALGAEENDARTISVEVGMQNSGLATELARSNFPAFPLATVPGAISALTHCLIGCLVAALCRLFPGRKIRAGSARRGANAAATLRGRRENSIL
jgi:BASS family bile acid:Na+ symporter